MDQVYKIAEAKEIFDSQLSDKYEGLMYYDKLEETFVRLISNMLLGKYDLTNNQTL
jgi:hypothetical protein